MQKYNPETLFHSKTNLSGFIIDETQLKVGSSELIWLWVAIESESKEILGLNISKKRNMFKAVHFPSNVIEEYGEHSVSEDGGT
jgi:transposase-like protein